MKFKPYSCLAQLVNCISDRTCHVCNARLEGKKIKTSDYDVDDDDDDEQSVE